ncbi:MAG: cation transporter [Nitrososphaerota archaeon]|nr:cation transporter [Nitrososphaerota archaeon]
MAAIVPTCQSCGCTGNTCESCNVPDRCVNCVGCCCPAGHREWRMGRLRRALSIELISSAWMAVEVAGSIGIGILSRSPALLAFGGDSVVELFSAFVVLNHLRGDVAGSSGLGRRTALATALMLFCLVPAIGLGTAYSYASGLRPEGSLLGVAIAAGAALVMPYFWLEKRKIGKETRCLPLSVDAVESATCFFMSLALLAGLLAEYLFGLWWADYLATAVILVFVGKEALESYMEVREGSVLAQNTGLAAAGGLAVPRATVDR